jgi:hypothetical protein
VHPYLSLGEEGIDKWAQGFFWDKEKVLQLDYGNGFTSL